MVLLQVEVEFEDEAGRRINIRSESGDKDEAENDCEGKKEYDMRLITMLRTKGWV